jgi:CheY-like chemotaxis protein
MMVRLSAQPGRSSKVGAIWSSLEHRYRAVKILLCADSDLLLQAVALTLEPAGHQVASGRDPFALAASLEGAAVLLTDQARGRQAAAVLRDRGFAGRTLLLADGAAEELAAQARELQLDGWLELSPTAGLASRLQLALERKRKVLIVDDSEIVARLLAQDLAQKGFEIQYAPDAEKATSIILKRATRPDLILLDINMPKVDGAQFCKFLKRNEMFKGIKVLFCSGEDREKVARLATECGADGYILKGEVLGRWVLDNSA